MAKFTPQVALAPHTTLNVGGKAEYFASASSTSELQALLKQAHTESLPVTVLGGGSNALVADAGVAGLVIKNEIMGIRFSEATQEIIVGAGEWFDDVVAVATKAGYWGLENLSGIPGTMGGGVVQNINAYGVTLGDLIHSVTAIEVATGAEREFRTEACQFAYRDSVFKKSNGPTTYIVTSVHLKASRQPLNQRSYKSATQSINATLAEMGISSPQPTDVRSVVLSIRENIGMLFGMHQSAGSFFKNPVVTKEVFSRVKKIVVEKFSQQDKDLSPWHWPVGDTYEKISAAFLMECTPYNKTSMSGLDSSAVVGISPQHSLSIVTTGAATAADVVSFADTITAAVQKEFGVALEWEVTRLGS